MGSTSIMLCGSTNIDFTKRSTREGADVGFAFDGDGHRFDCC